MQLIEDERRRQVAEEGWTLAHDREHGPEPLTRAAVAYEMYGGGPASVVPAVWPFSPVHWKPRDALRNLIRAGALYAAAQTVCGPRYQELQESVERCAAKIDEILTQVDTLTATE